MFTIKSNLYQKKLYLKVMFNLYLKVYAYKMFPKIPYNALHGIILFRLIVEDSSDFENSTTFVVIWIAFFGVFPLTFFLLLDLFYLGKW